MRLNAARRLAAAAVVLAAALGACGTGPGAPSGRPSDSSPSADPATRATTLPTFDPATTVGGYAQGFPLDLLKAPQDATVLASSAQPGQDSLVDITLNLATPHDTAQVLDELREQLRDAGFEETTTDSRSGLSAQAAFTRVADPADDPVVESVLVGVLDEGERRLVTVSGSVVVRG